MQRAKHLSGWFVGCTWMAAAIGCAGASESPDVNFTDGTPLGRWQTDTAPAQSNVTRGAAAGSSATQGLGVALAGSLATGPISSTSPGVTPQPASSTVPSSTPMAFAGTGALPAGGQPTAGRAAPSGGAGTGASTKPPAAGAPATETSAGALKSLAFEVTTSPVGLRYQPKNIGAIWIQDGGGTFVKSLKVWARVRARYLTKYSAARGGQAVDVTASATLTSHQTHSVTWDMKDRSGAAVAPGKYAVCAELTDGDATGKSTCIELDTSSAPKVSNPPDAACFNAMKLELK